MRAVTKSYAGRQVDLELLKHVEDPAAFSAFRRVDPDVVPTPRIVAGVEKAVQRYTRIFLTTVGTVRLAKDIGNDLLRSVALGRVQNKAILNHLYSIANAKTLAVLREDDADTTYGAIPDDERIVSTRLKDLELVYDAVTGGRVRIHIFITTAAGEGYTFVIPVAAGVS